MSRFTAFFYGLGLTAVLFMSNTPATAADDQTLFKVRHEDQEGVIEKVLSADTVKLKDGTRVRLIGLKAPEVPKRQSSKGHLDKYGFEIEEEISPDTTIEERAFEFVRHLLEGKVVRLEYDNQSADESSVPLVYLFLTDENIFVNAEILRQGFAALHLSPLNSRYSDQLRAAYREARAERRGLQGQ